VVLVSWMRQYEFWKQESRKSAGLDLERLRREGRFAFVDGLGVGADAPAGNTPGKDVRANGQGNPQSAGSNGVRVQREPHILPVRGPPGRIVPARGPPIPAATTGSASFPAMTATASETTGASSITSGYYNLKTLELADIKSTVSSAVSALATSTAQRKTLLVFDNPDLLLALNPSITPSGFASLALTLHTMPTISHVLTHIQSDSPLLSLSTPPQPLELAHHNLLVKLAHMSRRILSVRILDTGVARDVSGVIRITEQKRGWLDFELSANGVMDSDDSERGKEFLYQVKGDGSVKVFERGAGGEV
jgi:elongator complex protein 6